MTPKPDTCEEREIERVKTDAAHGYTGPSSKPTIAWEYD